MESCHRSLLLLILVTASILASPAAAAGSSALPPPLPPNPLFVLGDRTATCGTIIERLFNQYVSCHHSGDGLPDLLAQRMGLRRLTPFLLGSGLTGAQVAKGINFAVLRSAIISEELGYTNGLDRFYLPSSLSRQVQHAQQALQRLYFELEPAEARRVLSSAVFLLSFGTNDYVDVLQSGGPRAVRIKFGPRGIARVLVQQMEHAVKSLYNGGVRKIACMGVGPLGCSPGIMWRGRATIVEGKDCIEEANEVVSGYNARLSRRLLKLQKELPGLQIVFCDIYQGIMEIISNPLTYGFKDVKTACCGFGRYGGLMPCMTPNSACKDSSSHVWWDLYSTTKEVNSLLANWSWLPPDPKLQICRPTTLHDLAV